MTHLVIHEFDLKFLCNLVLCETKASNFLCFIKDVFISRCASFCAITPKRSQDSFC